MQLYISSMWLYQSQLIRVAYFLRGFEVSVSVSIGACEGGMFVVGVGDVYT